MSKEIQLTQDKVALVDNADFELASRFKWYLLKAGRLHYAICCMYMGMIDGKGKTVSMTLHRLIMRPQQGMEVDHRDHDGLNCQRSNMRVCTHSQNIANERKCERPRTSQYKGVYWNMERKKWRTEIRINGTKQWLGYFTSEIEAAKAYDIAAKEHFGEFSCTNF